MPVAAKNVHAKGESTHPTPAKPSHTHASAQSQSKRKKTDISDDISSIDAALNKLCSIANQDVFDNFGNFIVSQLRSIPMDDALELQAGISEMVNRRLLAIHRAKRTSSCEASGSSSQTSSRSAFLASPIFSAPQAPALHSSSHASQNLQTTNYETYEDSQLQDPSTPPFTTYLELYMEPSEDTHQQYMFIFIHMFNKLLTIAEFLL